MRSFITFAAVVTSLLTLLGAGAASAAVGDALRTITPKAATVGSVSIDPLCGSQGGTSVAIVQGSKLLGVDATKYPMLLATSCLDNGGSADAIARRARVSFLDPSDPITSPSSGAVIAVVQTKINGVVSAPNNGWAHLVHRADAGDLLGCSTDGLLFSIDYSRFTATADGTATSVAQPGLTSCTALGWDAEADMVYQGIGGNQIKRFKPVAPPAAPVVDKTYTLPCAPSGISITGGVLVVACDGVSTVLRLDKESSVGAVLIPNGTLGVLGLAAGSSINPDLGDLACDPVTFQKHPTTGKDQFKDAMWSRNGANGNGLVALEFPAFTCGLPSNATVLRAGLSSPGPQGAGEVPRAECFDGTGNVIDADDDGLPDCWETSGIDFDGDGGIDLTLCVPVDTNGDGVTDTTACASPTHKDLYVEIDYMQFHKPDPKALSQAQSVASVGVQSVREAFAVAPVSNPDGTKGIRIHFLVDEQATFPTLKVQGGVVVAGPTASHADELVFTPCTPPAVNPNGSINIQALTPQGTPSVAADFDEIKKANFGTAAERASQKTLNAKRLAFRYTVFGHKQVGVNQAGAGNSGCAELPGDDLAITLGGFLITFVDGQGHGRGSTDEQAGTLMHEIGHTVNLRHGGGDNVNCKPNYRSVMSYTRQFQYSPLPIRRLDYSRAADPFLTDPTKSGRLTESSLNEFNALGFDATLGPITQDGVAIFPSPDYAAYGPGAFSNVAANQNPINWNRSKQGPNPTYQNSATADLNAGAGGCDGSGTELVGHDDWENLVYRPSAALDFAGGVRTADISEVVSITSDFENELFLAGDVDENGIGDAVDCGAFTCLHRIDIKPPFPLPKTIVLGTEATVTVAIFSEKSGNMVWDAANIIRDATLTFAVGGVVKTVKVNNFGLGTCSMRDTTDPITGAKDNLKDALCQFPTGGVPLGTNYGIVSGRYLDPATSEIRAFRARQGVTVTSGQ